MSYQIVSNETKAVFKDFVSKFNQIESSGSGHNNNDYADIGNYSPTSLMEGTVPDFVNTSGSNRTAVNVDKSMMRILSKFGGVISDNVKRGILTEQEESNDPEFNMAMKTRRTPEGVQMAGWEIVKIIKFKESKYVSYNIRDRSTGKNILENVGLYRVATSIVNLLEGGTRINDRDITRLLRLDEDFNFYYQEAVFFKEKYEKTQKDLYEHRHSFCKGKVENLKEQLLRECR